MKGIRTMNPDQKDVIQRAAELARENARRLQQPMPHTIRRRKAQEKKGRK
jgi:hypothetical protein